MEKVVGFRPCEFRLQGKDSPTENVQILLSNKSRKDVDE
ncbi:hypothetical protein LEP1GSC158_3462 [Leptospira interrogans serovar Zanoni str. LT2156]|uniref:Uncharacterized protein n=1 Tax=Leptospira interrogans serovar Zanoni str. LT2156 TaxID=1001601 RepID=M6HFV2_LEPIR|nr:hypothetical protein LEP1GSC158_3462 [Leptospira interrogans serovar Zanoni str. LT2156]